MAKAPGEMWEGEEPDIIRILEQEALIEPVVVPPGVEVESVSVEGLRRSGNWVADVAAGHLIGATTIEEVQVGIQAAQNQLLNLGIFHSIDTFIAASQGANAKLNGVDVVFEVDEDISLLNVKTSANIGNSEGKADAKFALKNPLGLGDQVTASGMMTSGENTSFELVYQLPVGANADYPLQYGLYQTKQEIPQSSHAQLHRGAFARYQTYSLWGQHSLRYDAVWRNTVPSADSASFKVREEAGHTLKSALSHTVEVDMKDLSGDFGGVLKIENELAGFGGDTHFFKNSASYSHRMALYGGCSFAFSARGGSIEPLLPEAFQKRLMPSGTTIFDSLMAPAPGTAVLPPAHPPTELRRPTLPDRFFLGGVNDVRGFQHRGIGPRAKEDALGGDAFWAVGANLYTPLPFESWREKCGENLQCHLFANAGACVATGAAVGSSVLERLSQNTAVSLGLGLTAKMQNIQLELNYCFPVEFGPEDRPTPGLQFGAGFSFL